MKELSRRDEEEYCRSMNNKVSSEKNMTILNDKILMFWKILP